MNSRFVPNRFLLSAALAVFFVNPLSVRAHCDSLEGPVVQDARKALEKGDPTPVLKWVGKQHEDEIRDAFMHTVVMRAKGEDVQAFADRYFFETLVRIHRAGEGEAYTGLKPAGSVDPGIAAADKALQSGNGRELAKHLAAEIADGIRKRFELASARKKHAADSVEAGREYVEAYVDYIHFVESANRLVAQGVSHQHHEPAPFVE